MRNAVLNTAALKGVNYDTGKVNIKIFISDDSPVVRVRLTNMLSDVKGIDLIGEAANVQDSIDEILRLRPDVVILDIRMPGGSGIDVLKRIKSDDYAPVVIVLTNYPFPQYRKICTDNGADYFFDKSNEFHRVLEVLKNLHSYSKPN